MRILITGQKGMVGSAIKELVEFKLLQPYAKSIFLADYGKLERFDLTSKQQTHDLFKFAFKDEKEAKVVIHCAGLAAGINFNVEHPAEMIYQNSAISANVIEQCRIWNVDKLINVSSACIYPSKATQPFLEKDIFSGSPEKTNEFYSLGKLLMLKLIEGYNRQYKTNYYSLMCPNIYGKNDHFNDKGHVIPQLLQRFHNLKKVSEFAEISEVLIQGESFTEREFIYAEDLAKIIVWFAENIDLEHIKAVDDLNLVNVCGYNYKISEVIETIQNVVGTSFKLKYTGRNTGIGKKQMSDRIFNQIYKEKINYKTLRNGLQEVYEHCREKL